MMSYEERQKAIEARRQGQRRTSVPNPGNSGDLIKELLKNKDKSYLSDFPETVMYTLVCFLETFNFRKQDVPKDTSQAYDIWLTSLLELTSMANGSEKMIKEAMELAFERYRSFPFALRSPKSIKKVFSDSILAIKSRPKIDGLERPEKGKYVSGEEALKKLRALQRELSTEEDDNATDI